MKKILMGLSVFACLCVASNAQALIIDDFNSGDQDLIIDPANLGDTLSGSAANRDIFVEVVTTGLLPATRTRVAGGILDVSNSTPVSTNVVITWDDMTNLDLTEAGTSTGFFLAFPSPIDNDLDIAFDINTGASTFSTTFPDGSFGNDFFIPFASFSDNSVFTSVDSIIMTLSNGPGWDAQIDFVETRPESITTVPEPGSLLLMGLGLVGLAGIGRRKLKA